MFHKIIQRIIGVLLIAQTILMFVATHTSIHVLHQILVIEAIVFLLIAPWFFKKHYFISIVLIIIGVGILLSEYFTSMKQYYTFITFIPSIAGIILLIGSYIGGKNNKKPASS